MTNHIQNLKEVLQRRFRKQGNTITDKVVSTSKASPAPAPSPIADASLPAPALLKGEINKSAVEKIKDSKDHKTAYVDLCLMSVRENDQTMLAVNNAIEEKYGSIVPPEATPNKPAPQAPEPTTEGHHQVSSAKVYHIVKEGYLLCFDNGKVYFQYSKDCGEINPGIPNILAHGGGSSISAPTMRRKKDGSREFTDETKYVSLDEMNDLVKNKPTVATLFQAYHQIRGYGHDTIVVLDPENIVAVW